MKPANEWTPEEQEIYEVGHREGESCRQADWMHALSDMEHDLPEEIWEDDLRPSEVAKYIDKLYAEREFLRAERQQWKMKTFAEIYGPKQSDADEDERARLAYERTENPIVPTYVMDMYAPVYPPLLPMYGVVNPGEENETIIIATERDVHGVAKWRLPNEDEKPGKR